MESAKQLSKSTPLFPSLPVYLTRLVGRKQELATLTSLLSSRQLLTLVGPGGIGKTRLALHIAKETAASFTDGVCLIELASLTEPALVPQAIASLLNIRTDQDSSVVSLVIAALKGRHCLLLLDNCEHVLPACASLVEAILQACPHVHILATSREPLDVAEETVWPVAALSLPQHEQTPILEQVAHSEAIQLFCERAAESNPHIRLTPQNASAIASICHQLDGIPLALELVAARLSVLSIDQLAARLKERFTLLTDGERIAPLRHRTLYATLDWSYALLTSAEQALFRHLAVFTDSWNLDAVEQIIEPITIELYKLSDVLAHLVNKSLVIAEEQERPEGEGKEVRYRLLNTVQQYAIEKLKASGDWQQACERHHTWYLHLAEEANSHLHGAEQLTWLHYLDTEMPNIRVALTRSLATGHIDTAIHLAEALCRFWIIRNLFSEGRYWFETLLTATQSDTLHSPSLRARVLFGASEFARYQGAHERACALLEEQIAVLQTLDDPLRLADARTYLGTALGLRGEYERARQLCQASLDFYRERKQTNGVTRALIALSFIALAQKKYLYAMTLGEEACQLLREAGDYSYLLYALFPLAQATILQRKLEQARAICREALQISQMLNQPFGLAASIGLIAGIAALQGQPIQAARFFGAAQALQERVQAPLPPSGRALQEQMVIAIRSTLGKEQFLLHYSAGQQSPLAQILSESEAVLQAASTPSASDFSDPLPSSPATLALATLSLRERQTLALVAAGLTDAQVAQHLLLSPHTIKKHLQSIYTKLNINTRSAATRFAVEHGII